MTSLRLSLPVALLLALGGLLFLAPSGVQAQQMPDTRTLMNPTVKEYGRPGYPRMTIYVWGNADGGVWNVEKGTDLLEFVSVVSRMRMMENSPDRRRIETLSIYRDQVPQGKEDPFFEARIEELFSEREAYPALEEGDILVLETETRRRFSWRDIARVTGTIAAVVNTYLLLDRLGDNN